jgi:uncharacterized protein (UPF0335 family)
MDVKQEVFLAKLQQFIDDVERLKQFKGKAQVLRVLRRIPNLSIFQ